MEQPRVHAGVFYHANLDQLKKAFIKKFTLVQAAGGLVKNEKDEILMIFRRDYWDFPKGKLDKNEKLETCALREVEEETGLKNIELKKYLLTTYHTYHEGTRHILKESHWFNMIVKGEQKLIPQTNEDISEVTWIDRSSIGYYLKKAYPMIADIMEAAKQEKFIVS